MLKPLYTQGTSRLLGTASRLSNPFPLSGVAWILRLPLFSQRPQPVSNSLFKKEMKPIKSPAPSITGEPVPRS
jgi:hypothetical protein